MARRNPENPTPPFDAAQLFALAPQLRELLKGVSQVELEHFTMEIGDLDLFIPMTGTVASPATADAPGTVVQPPVKPTDLIRESYTKVTTDFPGRIREVRLGATKAEGGSRRHSITIGGATAPAYSDPARPPLHSPVISLDVFDMPVTLPRVLRENVADVIEDPAEWAKMNVQKFGADVVTVHLTSTDPLFRDASASAAVKTVESVLQAVDVPLIIGGCGDPRKDAEVFCAVAEMAEGERLLINSVTLDMAEAGILERVATAARDHGHAVLAFTGLDLNNAKELNRRLYEYIPPEQIVMDLTTVALGYGLEYSFTIHERARYAALMGDTELAHPTISAATNAWAAREAWMKMAPEYGSRQLRGPVWETVNALTLLLAGVDLFLMMHPAAVLTMREVIPRLPAVGNAHAGQIADWVGVRL
ncbi:CO dehydrogenase/acetyl-CoA synthase subunit delta [Methanoregula sp.]|uniref:CO dehydrogenase/acetyl-CoA synthase subunit delta n=1 Tax=Methanoregula sp. TaxID=2052170 RepID=UPI00262FCBE5|nr:CO dehydrogenase/acetyl-CoA synthase subunit delta [Methanoregula sp.]MDD5141821.1 CO dehydrogenase/acetyl-CoA synthase subunit delta [Methanoregula sp.]